MSTTATTGTTRTEKVLVLYGSQTGNSEEAAKSLCQQFATELSPSRVQTLAHTGDWITLEPTHMQLDDFLELEKAAWTRLAVIFVSSYGVGGAPLGGYRFRELCDAWTEQQRDDDVLNGVHFALCGLGDSKYTTFFQNPTVLDTALRRVGAVRVGPLGRADASGTGDQTQSAVIEAWTTGIWPYLAHVAAREPLSPETLAAMQTKTVALCRQINPDFAPPKPDTNPTNNAGLQLLSVLIAILSIAGYFYFTRIQ